MSVLSHHTLSLRTLLATLLLVLFVAPGCSTQKYPDPYEQPASIERPARSLGEEDTSADKAGKVVVVILAVGAAIGAIATPIILLALGVI